MYKMRCDFQEMKERRRSALRVEINNMYISISSGINNGWRISFVVA